jgi:hypothetical protein
MDNMHLLEAGKPTVNEGEKGRIKDRKRREKGRKKGEKVRK